MNRSKILIYLSFLHAIKEVHRDSLIFVDLKSSADSDACLFVQFLSWKIKKNLVIQSKKEEYRVDNSK